jgi:thioredoxin 1
MSENIVTATDDSFAVEVLQSTTPVLVDFWASWCGPCRMLSPIIEAAAKELSGRIKIVKLNVDENSKTASDYNIRGIPTLMIFKEGKIVATKTGVLTQSQLTDFVNTNLV